MNFRHTQDTIDALRLTLSDERLIKYIDANSGNYSDAITLYEQNTRASEAFYTPLQSLEIALRNKMHTTMAQAYGYDWLTNGQPPLKADALENITKAIKSLGRNTAPEQVSAGAIIAQLSFGFWVGLLGPRYDATLFRNQLYRVFNANGRNMSRKVIHGRLNMIKRFRNRIAHHEPIFQYELSKTFSEIIEATSWLCQKTAVWSECHSRVLSVLTK